MSGAMPDGFRLRQAVRAVILSPDARVLLVRFESPIWAGWALPGGGVEEGEDDIAAIRRELAEEVGLLDAVLVGPIWERAHVFPVPTDYDGQAERIYLVECAVFDPSPMLTREELRAEGIAGLRWWALDELVVSSESFLPTALGPLLVQLHGEGPPATVVTIGE